MCLIAFLISVSADLKLTSTSLMGSNNKISVAANASFQGVTVLAPSNELSIQGCALLSGSLVLKNFSALLQGGKYQLMTTRCRIGDFANISVEDSPAETRYCLSETKLYGYAFR